MRIAISGTIGSGKSAVSKYLRYKGYEVLSADEINKDLLKKDHLGYIQLVSNFTNILDDADEINKAKLANIVFNDKKELKKLNDIMHPLIKTELVKSFNKDIVMAEIPLLFETDFYKLFDYYLIVIADDKIIEERLIKRGMDISDIKSRINNQVSQEEKISKATYVINNNGDIDELYSKVDRWLESIGLC